MTRYSVCCLSTESIGSKSSRVCALKSHYVVSPDNGDAFGDVTVENEVFDGDQSVDVNLSVDEGDSDQIV